jgi:hypothetical protein
MARRLKPCVNEAMALLLFGVRLMRSRIGSNPTSMKHDWLIEQHVELIEKLVHVLS